jgi:arylsulfatase A-like enzyme
MIILSTFLFWLMFWFLSIFSKAVFASTRINTLAPNTPNILIYLVDDLGWMDTGVYGSQSYITPNIDRLARSGLLFTDAYTPNPMCTPSRAGLLTGKYPSRFRITLPDGHLPPQKIPSSGYPSVGLPHLPYICPESRRFLSPSEWTLSKYLKSVGYRTGFVGKWHLGLQEWTWPEHHGFDTVWHGYPDNGPPLPHGYFAPYNFLNRSITAFTSDEHLVERVTEEGIKFIQSNMRQDSPFFLLFSQYGVHAPWQAHLKDIQENSQKFQDSNHSTRNSNSQNNPIMASMVSDVDKSVGKIMDHLTSLNLMERTVFLFTSDNGGDVGTNSHLHRTLRRAQIDPSGVMVPEWMRIYRQYAGESAPTTNFPLRGGKGSLYEGGLRIPFILSYPPLIKSKSISSTSISLIDIFPTIHHLVSEFVLKSPVSSTSQLPQSDVQFDGVSLLPLVTSHNTSTQLKRRELFGFFPHGPVAVSGVSLRSQEGWKFIRRFSTGNGRNKAKLYELYDLSTDLGEKIDLSDSYPLLVKDFTHRINQFIANTNSLIPIPNPRYNKTLVE